MDNDLFLSSAIPPPHHHSSAAPIDSFLWDHRLAFDSDISCYTSPPNLTSTVADPGFAERAARFSCFGSRSFNGTTLLNSGNGKLSRVSSSPLLMEPTVSEHNPIGEHEPHSRKRKTISKAKGKQSQPPNIKRSKEEEDEKEKAAEGPKDYIHVRARRGQATDSHSLAERVRREKIGERMKLLQDLVPGCNKVTGKALMLDEIINYVQSLQGQVEFLSMKLASVNTTTPPNSDSLLSKSKHMFQSHNNTTLTQPMFPSDSSAFFVQQNQALRGTPTQSSVDPLDSALGFGEGASQYPRFCEDDDLQSIVQMGFAQNVHGSTQEVEASPMKIEL